MPDIEIPVQLATCSISAHRVDMGLAVRTSVGHPRFWKKEKPLAVSRTTAPQGIQREMDPEVFETKYRAILDRDPGAVAEELKAIANGFGAERLVLLCFENLSERGKWCHRTILATWLEERTGIDVPELAPAGHVPKPEPKPGGAPPQQTLDLGETRIAAPRRPR